VKLVTPPLVVDPADSFKNDLLDRRAYGEALLNLATRSSDALVISLDGKWGEGKTTFVKMWQGLLAESGVPTIYIDAFSNDYLDDPFIAVASAITSYAEENIKKEFTETVSELKDRSMKVGGQLLSWSAKLAVKAATLGIIKDADIEELNDIRADLSKTASDLVGGFIEDRIKEHAKDVEFTKSFKELLSRLPAQLGTNEEQPLVVIVDELDRCKPTYAVELIEKIKHIFSVENVVFLLVLNMEQLEEAIRCVYGQRIDAHTYLQKFVNIEAKLPKRTDDRYPSDLSAYAQKLLQLHQLETWGDNRNIVDCLAPLAHHFNLSLRQLEKVFTNLAVFYASISQNELRLVPVVVFLAVIKVVDPSIFHALLHQKLSFSGLIEKLDMHSLDDDRDSTRKLSWLMQWIRYGLLTEQEFSQLAEDDEIRRFSQSLFQYSFHRDRLVSIAARQLSMFSVR